ncbi:helix-turn-helix transcriptional regulator [Limnoglobus roseus]|uniref:Helix-turn-helix domain-containing protein n=1 Tax=Limnoglobus roseus TaxID=2598579 RepID=A0A5C1AJU1_9BACT|nr:helix-turn-helix domain-containing protein [Limnoglobus roseus]QEL17414.1 hypothetical protein PX52LOC_04403 [Limnoglobus roseus]
MAMTTLTEVLTVNDVTQTLGVGKTTLYRWIESGRFPRPISLAGGRVVRWTRATLEKWLSEQEATQTPAR